MTAKQIVIKTSVAFLLIFFNVSISIAQVVEEAPTPEPTTEEVFEVVDEMPRFPGCEDIADKEERKLCAQKKMLKYIYGNLKWPVNQGCISGTCVIRFYVDIDGSIKDAKILKDLGGGSGEEALRIVNSMNDMPERWTPGKERGQVVKVYYNLPIKFRLQ